MSSKLQNLPVLALLVVFSQFSHAAPTNNQIKKVMTEKSIPNWRAATEQSKTVVNSPPNNTWKKDWEILDLESIKGNGKSALNKASDPKNVSDLQGNAIWLRWKILSGNADGRYSYAYSYLLSLMKDAGGNLSQEIAVFLYNARLSLSIDGARCEDRSSIDSVIAGYESQRNLLPILEMVDKLPQKVKAVALLEAVAIEEMRGERTGTEYLCGAGTKIMKDALNQGRQFEKLPDNASENAGINSKGNTYGVDITGIKPSLISEVDWQKKRREILELSISNAAKSL
ncbi:MAG: hypothetical protein WC696_06595 [Candidatus Methylopumilus sp.]|jgi:hypothetical protein